MLTVCKVLERLFPTGTNLPKGGGMDRFPRWPPDLFAGAASLVDRTGCYSHSRYAGGRWCAPFYDDTYYQRIASAAGSWKAISLEQEDLQTDAETAAANPPLAELTDRWRTLITCNDVIAPCDPSEPLPAWCDSAMWLLAVADEAPLASVSILVKAQITSDKNLSSTTGLVITPSGIGWFFLT